MKIGEATPSSGITLWGHLWRGIIWVAAVELTAYALGIPWSIGVCALCIVASFVDAMLRPTK